MLANQGPVFPPEISHRHIFGLVVFFSHDVNVVGYEIHAFEEEDATHLFRAYRGGSVERLEPRVWIVADDSLALDAFSAFGDNLVKVF